MSTGNEEISVLPQEPEDWFPVFSESCGENGGGVRRGILKLARIYTSYIARLSIMIFFILCYNVMS